MYRIVPTVLLLAALIFIIGCNGDPVIIPDDEGIDLTEIRYDPTILEISYPENFPRLEIPEDNVTTVEGAFLGRNLFYDPILSVDSTISCSSCHHPETSFSDENRFSLGVNGQKGKRQSMSLLNVAFFKRGLFWDGRSTTLEEQAVHPVEDPVEMNNVWADVEIKLRSHPDYPILFRKAFGIVKQNEITRDLVVKALAQFERTLVSSGMSKFDRIELGLDVYTDEELLGRDLFFDENPDVPDAECGHCHNTPLGTSDDYFNNGLDGVEKLTDFIDLGKGKVTGNISDNGKFRAPSLRNIIYTAPYMHDGRFSTLDEVIDHYNSGGKNSPNKDPLIRPLGLTEEYKAALKAFILTMTEPDFNDRASIQSPFQ